MFRSVLRGGRKVGSLRDQPCKQFDIAPSPLWSQLFPAQQARTIQLLVRRVTVTTAELEIDIRREGIAGVVREMVAPRRMAAAE